MSSRLKKYDEYVPGGFGLASARATLFHRAMWVLGLVAVLVGIVLMRDGFLPASAVPDAQGLLASLGALLLLKPDILRDTVAEQADRLAAALALRLPMQLLLARQQLGRILGLITLSATSLVTVTRSARDRERSIVARMRTKTGVPDLTLHPRLASAIVAGSPF